MDAAAGSEAKIASAGAKLWKDIKSKTDLAKATNLKYAFDYRLTDGDQDVTCPFGQYSGEVATVINAERQKLLDTFRLTAEAKNLS